jgi:hypothetical protein
MILAEHCKGCRSLGACSRRRPQLRTQELHRGVASSPAPAVIKPHLVHPMHVEDDEVVIGRGLRYGAHAVFVVPVTELYPHAQILQCFPLKHYSCPVLSMVVSVYQGSYRIGTSITWNRSFA